MTRQSNLEVKLSGVRTLADREFVGLGSTFDLDLQGDRVQPGAFRKSLEAHRRAGTWPIMLWSHDPSKVPGAWRDIRETAAGLEVHGELADTELGREVHTLLKMQAVGGLSIGYRAVQADYADDGSRRLLEVELHEVSVVSLPANPAARVSQAKLAEAARAIQSVRDYERLWSECFGFSRGRAKVFAAQTWKNYAAAVGADDSSAGDLSTLSEQLDSASAAAILLAARDRIARL